MLLALIASITAPGSSANILPPQSTNEDLTARECLAAARRQRQAQNWAQAASYYQRLESEFGDDPQSNTHNLAYRLEMVDCLLKIEKFADSVPHIERLLKEAQIPPEVKAALLLRKGECEHRLKKFAVARASLSPLLCKSDFEHPGRQQMRDRAFLLIAESLLAENLNKDAIEHLSRDLPLTQAVKCIGASLKATACLGLHLPETASDILAASAAQMRTLNIMATHDSLLLQTARQLAHRGNPHEAIRCILRTANPNSSARALSERLEDTTAQMVSAKQRKDPRALNALSEQQAVLRSQIQLANTQKELLAETVLTTATSLLSTSSPREAATFLKYFVDLQLSMPSHLVAAHQKMRLGCLLKMERWEEAKSAAEKLEGELIDPKQHHEIMLFKGIAIAKTQPPASAVTVFETIRQRSADPELTARATILCASTQLETGDYAGATSTAKSFAASKPNHPLCDTAQYIIVAASLAAGDHLNAVAAADRYLKDKTKVENRELVEFYKAKALYSLNEPAVAKAALRTYISRHPRGEKVHEATLLLGDALLSTGDATEGIATLQSIPSNASSLHDEAQLKAARALRLTGQPVAAADALTTFIKHNPQSRRIADACKELLEISRSDQTSLSAIQTIRSLLEHKAEDCRTNSPDQLIELLLNHQEGGANALCEREATRVNQTRTQGYIPCGCTIAKAWARWRNSKAALNTSENGDSEEIDQAVKTNPSAAPEKVLFEIALHHSNAKRTENSSAAWRELLRWHPCSKFKDAGLLHTGLAELEHGRIPAALKQFSRLETECQGSSLLPEMWIKRAEIYRGLNDGEKRLDDLMRIASAKRAPIQIRSRALLEIGAHKIDNHQDAEALAYLQRATLSALSQPEIAARAYERIGFALERLGNPEAAAKAYAEVLANPDLRETTAGSECRRAGTATPK